MSKHLKGGYVNGTTMLKIAKERFGFAVQSELDERTKKTYWNVSREERQIGTFRLETEAEWYICDQMLKTLYEQETD